MATTPRMTREQFIAQYGIGPGGTFLANDRGGNAASEAVEWAQNYGMDAGGFYDAYLGPNGKNTMQMGIDLDTGLPREQQISWDRGAHRDNMPNFDAWDFVNPHPESQRGNGLEEAWRQVGRPIATAAAMYGGVNALGGLLGEGAVAGAAGGPAASAGGTSAFSFGTPAQVATGIDLGAVPTVAGGGGSLGALGGSGAALGGAGGLGGSATKAALYGSTGYGPAATAAEMAVGGGSAGGLLGDATSWLKANPTLTQLGGAALGALSAKDQTQTSTQNRDPWGPAQQYLKDNLATNAAMMQHYQANPFSTEQKNAYQGLLNTIANNQANGNVLLGNASKFGQSQKGAMPQMQGLLTGTQAPIIDWAKYANIGLLGG